jgi:hypothetical protein
VLPSKREEGVEGGGGDREIERERDGKRETGREGKREEEGREEMH